MSMEFGWWATTPEMGKHQILVTVHGGNIKWECKQGHHSSWLTYGPPSDDDWDRLLAEANRRVPRRLLSPKQFADIERQRPK